jgi:pimeloyl-ACP methyl ester carboxylesterase
MKQGAGIKATIAGAAMIGVAGVAALRVNGSRVRNRSGGAQMPPTEAEGLIHHHLPTGDGGRLHVVEIGQGRPVVLLHGVVLQWWIWSDLMRLLSRRYRVLAWDMRGHGDSVAGADGVTMEATADDLALLLTALDVTDAVVVGHSMGGMTLGVMADRALDLMTDRVAGLVFVGSSASLRTASLLRGGIANLSPLLRALGQAWLRWPPLAYAWRPNDISTGMITMAFGTEPTADMIEDVRKMAASVPTETLAEAGQSLASYDGRAALTKVRLETEIVVGDHDKLTPPEHAYELARLIAGSRLTVLAGIGHQVMQERPEALSDAIHRLDERLAPASQRA